MNFEATFALGRSYQGIISQLGTSSPLLPAARAFIANMDRMLSLRDFAPIAIGLTTEQHSRTSPETRRLAAVMGGEFVGGGIHIRSGLMGSSQPFSEEEKAEMLRNFVLRVGQEALPTWAARNPIVNDGLWALLSSMVIGAWTAFEVLVKDALRAAIKAKPILAPKTKPVFSNWAKSRESYYNVFGTIASAAWTDLEPIFANQELFWLAKLRNVLAHNAGIADEESRKAFGSHPTWGKLKEGDRLWPEGHLIVPLIVAAGKYGSLLLPAVGRAL